MWARSSRSRCRSPRARPRTVPVTWDLSSHRHRSSNAGRRRDTAQQQSLCSPRGRAVRMLHTWSTMPSTCVAFVPARLCRSLTLRPHGRLRPPCARRKATTCHRSFTEHTAVTRPTWSRLSWWSLWRPTATSSWRYHSGLLNLRRGPHDQSADGTGGRGPLCVRGRISHLPLISSSYVESRMD